MNNKEFGKLLETRTLLFAIGVIKLSASLPNSAEGNVIKDQITRSGTSIGANYREANRPRSKADFRNKIKLCQSEASETVYWLEIITNLKWINDKEMELINNEADELLAIFTSIANSLNQ